jgi:hypothetical protein
MTRVSLRALVGAAALGYVGAIQWSYATIISPAFSYNGSVYRPAPDGSLVLAFLVSILPTIWLPIKVSRPSQVTLWVLYILGYVPSILIPYYILGSGFQGVLPLTLAIAVSFVLLSLMVGIRSGVTYAPAASMRTFENFVIGLAILLGAYIILAFGLNLNLPALANVYDVRSAFDQAVVNTDVPFAAYALDWSMYVVNPLLMLLGLRSKRFGIFAIGLSIELLVYGTTGYKSALLSVLLVAPLLIMLARRVRPVFGLSLATASVIMVLGSIIWDQANDSILATSLFVRRLIVVPGQLVADYFDFFSQHRTYGLSDSILASLGPAPYDLAPPHLIGAVYFNAPNMDANANLWADGFANFGFAGIFGFTVLLGVMLILLDSAASGRDLRITGALAGLMAIVLSNSALLTTILTHGLGLAIVLIFLMPQDVETQVQFLPMPNRIEPNDTS